MYEDTNYLEFKKFVNYDQDIKRLIETHLPMRSIIKERLIKGMRYDYKTDEIEMTSGKALNFIATYFEVKDRNKNKPEKRYLEFHGIAVGGFAYLNIHDLQDAYVQTKADFELNGKRYAPYSGQIIKTKESQHALV